MVTQREAKYGRSGWTWRFETKYTAPIGLVAVGIGAGALATHVDPTALIVGTLFVLAGALLTGTWLRARSRHS